MLSCKLLQSWICIWLLSQSAVAQPVYLELIKGKIHSPVAMDGPDDGSGRMFLCEQAGIIRMLNEGVIVHRPFLDIRNKVLKQFNVYSERGLLGLAFHPDYRHNGKFYVFYSAASTNRKMNHRSVIAEYSVHPNDPNSANPASERIVLVIDEPESNHNGGHLAFGPDGYLYIGSGDGGGANDEHGTTGNGQNKETLLGKMLRIDVNVPEGYRIPEDNPFVNKAGRDEIWAYGLRNPWKFSFDPVDGKLYCADVGQDEWEEINIIRKGGNYGWRVMEGNHPFRPSEKEKGEVYLEPIAEYNHDVGRCIIGGYSFYQKGHRFNGAYIFADWTGKLFVLKNLAGTKVIEALRITGLEGGFTINSLGQDATGSIYILGQKGIGPNEPAFVAKLHL